jgi:hypothetical protein
MGTPVTGIRIPSDLLEKIDKRAIAGKTRTDIVIELLRAGLALEQSEQRIEVDRFTVLDRRITELEALVKQLLDERKTIVEQPSKNALESASADEAVGAIVTKAAIATGDEVICPKCGSGNTAHWGRGKVRKNGTRANKLMCHTCGKTTMIG